MSSRQGRERGPGLSAWWNAYCRSSSQITHCGGATLLGVYWVPQAVQMNASISLFREHALYAH
jgi:hypothetical protein